MSFPDFQTVGKWLDEEAAEIPDSFYEGLNLGIILSENCVEAPESRGDLFVLGEYVVDIVGAMIIIYYGSFQRLFAGETEETVRKELRETLRHEFTIIWSIVLGNMLWKMKMNAGWQNIDIFMP